MPQEVQEMSHTVLNKCTALSRYTVHTFLIEMLYVHTQYRDVNLGCLTLHVQAAKLGWFTSQCVSIFTPEWHPSFCVVANVHSRPSKTLNSPRGNATSAVCTDSAQQLLFLLNNVFFPSSFFPHWWYHWHHSDRKWWMKKGQWQGDGGARVLEKKIIK